MLINFIKSLICAIITILPNNDTGHKMRHLYYKKRLKYLDDDVKLGPYLQIQSPEKLSIGKGTAINQSCYMNAYNSIEIGKYCLMGPHCVLSSTNHGYNKNNLILKQPPEKTRKISIGNDVWLNANVTITSGVTIGSGAIIGANSVVTKDIEPYTINAGVPTKKIDIRK